MTTLPLNNNDPWPSSRTRAICIWGIAALFIMLQFFLQMSVGIIAYQLRADLGLTALELSFISSAYYYVYIFLQIPAGMLIDTYGARKLLAYGGLVCSIGCWLFARSDSMVLAMLARIFMGSGTAFAFIASVHLIARWFPFRLLGLMMGLSETCGMIGAMWGNVLLAYFVSDLSWRYGFILASVMTMLLSVAAFLVIKDNPRDQDELTNDGSSNNLDFATLSKNLLLLIRNKENWLNGFYLGLTYIVVTVFCALWGPAFFEKSFAMTTQESTFACSLTLVGVGIGAPIIGWYFGHHYLREGFMSISSLIVVGILCTLLYLPTLPNWFIYSAMFTIGVFCSSLILCYTIAGELAPPMTKSTSIGFTNTLALITAPLLQPTIGYLLNILSNDISVDLGIEIYSLRHYRIALSILPLFGIIAFIIALYQSAQKFKQDRPISLFKVRVNSA